MLKIVGVLVLVGVLAGAAFGAAAALDPVGGGTIQHGGDSDLQCDKDGVYIDGWGANFDVGDRPPYGILDYVRVKDVDASCECCSMWVSLWNGDTFLGRSEEAHIPAGGGEVKVDFDDVGNPISVKDITKVDIFIEGGCPDAPLT